jgi:hypothetical protein
MQRDTDLSFQHIHGSPQEMLSSIEKIQKSALVRRGAKWPRIRQLCLSQPEVDSQLTSCDFIDLHLSYDFQRYVAVTYTWRRSDPVPASIPCYRISSEEDGLIEISPALNFVIHRAFKYAISQGLFSIWIDQLCIRQNDPEDVESHLQVMHKIYAQSTSSVALLSLTVEDNKMLAALETLKNFAAYRTQDRSQGFSHLNTEMEDLLGLLEHLLADQWFRRAWTFQERQFALQVDIAIFIRQQSGHVDTYFNIRYLHKALLRLLEECPRELMERSFISELSVSQDFETFIQSLIPLESDVEEETEPYIADQLVFSALERCGISCVSDLLAIFANVRDCVYRLESRPLNAKCFSYSTCVLVIILANHCSNTNSTTKISFAIRMDTNISRVMEVLSRGEIEILSNIEASDNLNPIYVVEGSFFDGLGDEFVLIPFLGIEKLETYAFTKRSGCTCTSHCLCLTPRLSRHGSHQSGDYSASRLRYVEKWAQTHKQKHCQKGQRKNEATEDDDLEIDC